MKRLFQVVLAMLVVFLFSMGSAFGGGVDMCKHFKYPDNLSVFGVDKDSLDSSQLVEISTCDGVIFFELNCERGHFHDQIAGEETPQSPRIIWGFVKDKDEKLRAYSRILTFSVSQKGVDTTFLKMKQNFGGEPKPSTAEKGDIYTWKKFPLKTKLKVGNIDERGLIPVEVNQYFEPLRPEGHK